MAISTSSTRFGAYKRRGICVSCSKRRTGAHTLITAILGQIIGPLEEHAELAVFLGTETRRTGQYGTVNLVFRSHSAGLYKLRSW